MKTASLFLLLFFFIAGCSENNDPVSQNSSSIYGKWEITSGSSTEKYLIISNDNTWHSLILDRNIYRYSFSGVCIITPGQINFGTHVMNYSITGNELRLTHPDQSRTAVRNNSAPDVNEWIKTVTPVDSISTETSAIYDLTFGGENIWWRESLKLFKLNTITKEFSSVTLAKGFIGPEWSGGYLWGFDYLAVSLVKIDPASGNFISSHSGGLPPHIRHLAFDGSDLWLDGDNSVLYKYDINLNAVTDSVVKFTSAYDMTFSNGYLYLLRDRVINKCSLKPLEVVAAYRISDIFVRTITSGNGSFWLHGSRYTEDTYENAFYKVELN